MGTFTDQHGLTMTAASADAVAAYDRTVDAYLNFRQDTGAHLKAAFAADPELAMGHCLKGYFFKLFAVPALEKKAGGSLATAADLAARTGANDREHAHIGALDAWCRGDLTEATRRWESILLEHPRDAVAIRLAHYNHFYQGHMQAMRDSLARVLPHWSESIPHYGNILGCYAFGLEESGRYDQAERYGREAVERNPADIWSVHAVAHVLEMQGRQREGIAWITGGSDAWADCHNFRHHLWWHLALFHIDRGEADAALALYDETVSAADSDEYLDLCNAVALLWRLDDAGLGAGARWADLAARCAAHAEDHLLVFADLHYLLTLAAAGEDARAAAMLDSLRQRATGDDTQATVLRRVGLPLGAGIVAFYAGEAGRAVDLMEPARYDVWRIGGSHAQRDLFAQLLIRAAMKAERWSLARALLAERAAEKPESLPGWQVYAAALEADGDTPAAAAARTRAAAIAST